MKHVNTNGYQVEYAKGGQFAGLVHAAIGLALLPPGRVQRDGRKALHLQAASINKPRLARYAQKFLTYMDETWLFGRYPISTWNFHETKRTTNNNAEGYNTRLNLKVNKHPNPYILTKVLKDELKNV